MTSRFPHWRGWPLLAKPIKVEEFADERGFYIIRAEVPGVDPETDLSVMVADGEVTIDVKRAQPVLGRPESEFHYGRQSRTVVLPRSARDETTVATYSNDGILEIRVRMARPASIGRDIPIRIHRS